MDRPPASFAGRPPPFAEKGGRDCPDLPYLDVEGRRAMQSSLFTLLTMVGLSAALIAGLTVWLVLHEPVVMVTMADALANGEYEPLLAALAQEFGGLLRTLARLL
jgi:hypothetical protein